ncbi:Site-specific recombinase, phage integrase family, partial [Pseudomonas syringae pv. maculicola]
NYFPLACEKANIQGLRLHDLRHEATSRLFERGFTMMEVASIT